MISIRSASRRSRTARKPPGSGLPGLAVARERSSRWSPKIFDFRGRASLAPVGRSLQCLSCETHSVRLAESRSVAPLTRGTVARGRPEPGPFQSHPASHIRWAGLKGAARSIRPGRRKHRRSE